MTPTPPPPPPSEKKCAENALNEENDHLVGSVRHADIPQLGIAALQFDRAIGRWWRLAARGPPELHRLHHLHPFPIRSTELPHDHGLSFDDPNLVLQSRQHDGKTEVVDVAQNQDA